MTRRALPLLLAVLALTSACGGPDKPLDLGFKEVPSDVVLGAQSTPTPAPGPSAGPALPIAPPPPSVVTLPPPPFEVPSQTAAEPPPPSPLPTAPTCPSDDPLAAPKLEAPTSIAKPPVAAAYVFDNVGTFAVSGADARTGTFPERTLRVVGNIVQGDGRFSYDVAERVGDTTTTTTYEVVTGSATDNGLFLRRMTYRRTDGQVADFTPTPMLKLAGFPLVVGTRTEQRAVDPATQTAMSFVSVIEGKARVYACGEPLDSWTVRLTEGRLLSATQDLQFESTYQLGTQFGGLVLRDAVAFKGTDGASGVTRSNRATISVVPRVP